MYSAISAKVGKSDLSGYALSSDVGAQIGTLAAKLKGVYDALSGLPETPAEFNLIENVAPALIALRSALSTFA